MRPVGEADGKAEWGSRHPELSNGLVRALLEACKQGLGRNSRLWVGLASAVMITTGLRVLLMTPQDSCLSLPCTEPQPISSKGRVTFSGEARSGSSSKPSLTPPAHTDPISFSPSSWGQVHQSPDDSRALYCAEQGLSIRRGPLPLSAPSLLHLGQLPGSGRWHQEAPLNPHQCWTLGL